MNNLLNTFDLPPEDINYLQDGLVRCLSSGQTLQDTFYQKLFEVAPHVEAMFSDDMAQQSKMFSTMIVSAVAEMFDPTSAHVKIKKLGDVHRKAGLDREMIELGRQPFLAAIKASIGPSEYEANAEKWNKLYTTLVSVMMGH